MHAPSIALGSFFQEPLEARESCLDCDLGTRLKVSEHRLTPPRSPPPREEQSTLSQSLFTLHLALWSQVPSRLHRGQGTRAPAGNGLSSSHGSWRNVED